MTLYATKDATVQDLRKAEPNFNFMIKDEEELPQMQAKLFEIASEEKVFILECDGVDPYVRGTNGDSSKVHLIFGKRRQHPCGCKVQ